MRIKNLYFVLMKKHFFSSLPLLFISCFAFAQTGGHSTYDFLNLNANARIAAMGGNLISVMDDDLNLFSQNPAALNPRMNNQLTLNYVPYVSKINYGYAAFAKNFDSIPGTFAVGVHYVNYGTFTRADETGQVLGEFSAGEFALNLGYAHQFGKDSMFSVGGNLKTIISSMESYSSWGMGLDLAGTYRGKKGFTASVVLRNIGAQFQAYTKGNAEALPFEIQVGISQQFAHLPFKISIIAHNLQKPVLRYDDPNDQEPTVDPLTGEEIKQKKYIGDNIMRHFIFGGEFAPGKRKIFSLRIGYNYMRRQELKVDTRPGTMGLSWGIGLKISKFRFSYARAAYHLAGASNHISISTNISDFHKKEKPAPNE